MKYEPRKGYKLPAFIKLSRERQRTSLEPSSHFVADMHSHFLWERATFGWDNGGPRLYLSHLRPHAHKVKGCFVGWNDFSGR